MKKKYFLLINLIPYLILLTDFMFVYLGLFNKIGAVLGYLHMIIFFLIFIFNILHFSAIMRLEMTTPSLPISIAIGTAIAIVLNTVLFMSIWYTAIKIESVMRGY